MSNDSPREILFRGHVNSQAIQVERQGNLLSLHFDNDIIQSQIDTLNPAILPLKGNRQMLSYLMFDHVPEKVVLVGCGGGSLARWFKYHLPKTSGIAIDHWDTIINIARRYFQFPATQDGWQLVHAEANQYLQNLDAVYDLIIIDLEINRQTPEWITSQAFLLNCHRLLSENGAINVNLIADTPEIFSRQLWPIRQVFSGRTYCHASQANNIFVTAFKNKPDTSDLKTNVDIAEKRYGIEFSLFYQELLRDNPKNSGIF